MTKSEVDNRWPDHDGRRSCVNHSGRGIHNGRRRNVNGSRWCVDDLGRRGNIHWSRSRQRYHRRWSDRHPEVDAKVDSCLSGDGSEDCRCNQNYFFHTTDPTRMQNGLFSQLQGFMYI